MKRVLMGVALLSVLVALAAAIAVPTLISTQLVKAEIVERIGAWAGVPATVRGRPTVSVFPILGVEVKDVVLSGAPGSTDEALITIPSLTASLKLVPLLFGRTEVASLTLVDPKVRVVAAEGDNGNLGVGCARSIGRFGITSTRFGGMRRGDVVLHNGTLICLDRRTGSVQAISDANIRFTWPDAEAAAKIAGEFRWRASQIEVDAELDNPREVFAGIGSRFWAKLVIEPTLDQENLAKGFDLSRKIDNPASDGESDAGASALGPIEVSGWLNVGERSLTLSETTLEVFGSSAKGALSLAFEEERPVLIGSLAFDQLDLGRYMQKLMQVSSPRLLSLPLSAEWLRYADVDLTASADEVDLGLLGLSDTEVKLFGRDGRMMLTLTKADVAGGRMEGRVVAMPAKEGVELRVSGRFDDVSVSDVGAVVWQARFNRQLIGLGRPPGGTAKAQFDLTATGDTVGAAVTTLDGWAVAALLDGSIDSIDVASTLERLVDGNTVIAEGYAPFIPVAGQTRFAWLTAHMEVEAGVARAERIRLVGDRFEVIITGEGDLNRGELEARGIAALSASDAGAGRLRSVVQLPFGVGGTMLAPVLVPGVPHFGHRSCDATDPLAGNWCGLSRNVQDRSNGEPY